MIHRYTPIIKSDIHKLLTNTGNPDFDLFLSRDRNVRATRLPKLPEKKNAICSKTFHITKANVNGLKMKAYLILF